MAPLSRKRFIKTAAGLVLPAWACSGQVVIPGAIMRTIPATGGSCDTLRDAEDTVSSFNASFLRYFASMFRAGANYNCCRVDVSIARAASMNQDVLMTLRANNAGDPAAGVLGTSDTIPNATIEEDFTFVTFTFASPVSLSSGTDYWIVLTRANASDGLQLYWEDDNGATVTALKEAANATPTTWNTVTLASTGVFRTFSS